MEKPRLHPVRRTIVRNAVNVAQPGDMLPESAVQTLGLRIGTDDEAEVGPVDADPEAPADPATQLEFRYDRPVVPKDSIPTAFALPVSTLEAPQPADDTTEQKRKSGK